MPQDRTQDGQEMEQFFKLMDDETILASIKKTATRLSNMLLSFKARDGNTNGRMYKFIALQEYTKSLEKSQQLENAKTLSDAWTLIFEIDALWELIKETGFDEELPDILGIIEELKSLLNKLAMNFEQKSNNQLAMLQAKISNIEQKADERLAKLDEMYAAADQRMLSRDQKLDNLANIVSTDLLTTGHSAVAEEEKKSANNLRTAAIIIMAVVIIFVAVVIWKSLTAQIPIEHAFIKLFGVFVISALPIYLARESSRHRATYIHFKQTAMDIGGVSPYLQELETEHRGKILGEMAPQLFNRTAPRFSKHDQQSESEINLIANRLIDKIPSA